MAGPRKVAIYGAGGFAREVAWLLTTLEHEYRVACFVEDGAAPGRVLNGTPVLSWEAFVDAHRDAVVTVAVGDPRARQTLVEKCRAHGFAFATLVHPRVEKSRFVEIGEGAVICAGCILTTNIVIGAHAHLNLDCTVGHDARIGEFATLAPGVHVSGNVHIGRHAYVGTGATLINGAPGDPLVVADGSVVAAGACVTQGTEPNALYAGVPAVLKKRY